MLEVLKMIGAILGIVAFLWRVRDLFTAYVHIDLSVSMGDSVIFGRATVENKSNQPKHIDNALLLVGPEPENPLDTYNLIAKANGLQPVTYTNDIADTHVDNILVGSEGRQLIPLDFFFSENVAIRSERLSYCTPISKEPFVAGVPYSVRFFVTGKNRLHRSTQDCFQVEPSTSETSPNSLFRHQIK